MAAVEGGTDERRLEFAKLFEILGIRIVKHRFGSECQNTTDGGERSEEANHGATSTSFTSGFLCGELQVGWLLEEEEGAEEDDEEVEEADEEAVALEDSWMLPPQWMPPL